ncbi:hypothetical protein [Allokutzneria oryzae]|uniref:ATPase n=1 Tax=Allokutzneria oryzae TaxID=1378989 RepID=A0ABV6A3S8_9PSEU
MSVREILRRFRPAGAPGAAAPAGVPADRPTYQAKELAPVLALLDDSEREAERIRQDGLERAAAHRRAGRENARAIVAEAEAATEPLRAAVAAAAQKAGDAELAGLDATARLAVERVRHHAAERMPALVDRAVALVLASLSEPVR